MHTLCTLVQLKIEYTEKYKNSEFSGHFYSQTSLNIFKSKNSERSFIMTKGASNFINMELQFYTLLQQHGHL